MAVRDAARRLGTRDLSDCDLYSSATPCPMCQGALYWAGIRRIHTDRDARTGSAAEARLLTPASRRDCTGEVAPG